MTIPDMKIRALAPWFGGKRTMAPDIVAELGTHTQYFEPFAGGLSIIMSKPPAQKETANDLHGDITNLAKVLQGPFAEDLYDRLNRVVMAEGLLDEARVHLDQPFDAILLPTRGVLLERAYWFFVASWMGRNGTAGTERLDYQIAVRWTKSGGSPTVRFRNAVESIPAWHERLRNVVVLRRDAFDILDRFEDDAGTAIYADPPYPAETRSNVSDEAQTKGGGGGRYLHEFKHGGGALFGQEDDHARLARILRAYKHARIVVSTYDCPRYRDLYDGWTFLDKTRQKHLHAQNGRGARPKEAPEVLIINGPSYTEKA